MQCVQANSMTAEQCSFLFEYLCEHMPQTADEGVREFVRGLPILPTFKEQRRRTASHALLCSNELLITVVGDISMLPETLLVGSCCG